MSPFRITKRKTILSPRQVEMLQTEYQGETWIGFSTNCIAEFADAYSQDCKAEFTRVNSQDCIFEFARADSSNWILAVGFLSEMIFLNCKYRFFSFEEYRTDMFKFTGTHRLVTCKYHQTVTKWHQVPYVLE